MHICYVDEAGCTGVLPSATSSIQPIFAIAGVIVDQTRLRQLTMDLLRLKRRFHPNARLRLGICPENTLDWGLVEIKGSDIRRNVADHRRNTRRHAIGMLDGLVGLLTDHQARLVGRLYVKGIGARFNGTAVYTSAMQSICRSFHNFLASVHSEGMIIADSRNNEQNACLSHSIFTQKFKLSGDDHCRILEMPVFGHSENHAGLQVADLLCSALLFPMAADAYCAGRLTSCHVRPGYRVLRERFGTNLRNLQHDYDEAGTGTRRHGIVVSDGLSHRGGALLFCAPASFGQ